ncbi:MAG: DUF4245 domain-containing protein [Marmoricola sp.]
MAAPRNPNRYELPMSNMVGAMVVVLLVVGAFVGWRALNRDNSGVGVQPVDYHAWLKAAVQDDRLAAVAPPSLPAGWTATSATYTSGVSPHWHLGVLTPDQQYVGLEEGLAPADEQVSQFVDANATQGPVVRIAGHRWQSYTDARGDHAYVRSFPAPRGGVKETLVIVGGAPVNQIRQYVASLRPAR